LDGRTLDELEAAGAEARAVLESHVAEHGLRASAGEADAAARAEIVEALAELRARIQERESAMEDPADLELQLEQARSERARLERHRDAARMAREELSGAAHEAHRRVAPHLNAALARELPRVTRGRYREAMVGE